MDNLRDGAFGLTNTNKLIRFYPGATGLKTGSTGNAGFCISATAKRDNMHLIAVIMGAPSSKERFADATKLLDYGFANYAIASSLVSDEELSALPVKKGTDDSVAVGISDDFQILLQKNQIHNIQKEIRLPYSVSAPISEKEPLGEVEFFLDGVSIGKADIVARTNVKNLGFSGMIKKLSDYYFFGN